jgi:hypothetical protein
MPVEEGPLIAFGQSVESILSLSDEQFLADIDWHESAPAKLRRAADANDLEGVIRLALDVAGRGRSSRPDPRKTNGDRQSLWSRHELDESSRAATLIRIWDTRPTTHRSHRNGDLPRSNGQVISADFLASLTRWTQMCADGEPLSLLETLVLFEIVRDAGRSMPHAVAAKLWRLSLTTAILRTNLVSEQKAGRDGSRFIEAELSWQAGLLFAPVAGADLLAASGRSELGRLLLESTDSGGIPAAEIMDDLPAWLTSLVRGREWGRRFGSPLFDGLQEKRFRSLIGAVSSLCRGDGGPAFSNGRANGLRGLWPAAAASLTDRRASSLPAVRYLASLGVETPRRSIRGKIKNGRPSRHAHRLIGRKRVNPVFQSDSSRLACLRNELVPDANSLTVLHHRRYPQLELATRGTVLLSGDWEIEIRVGGEDVDINGPWVCSCWYSDDDGDYLELQSRPTATICIERQLLLARNDDLLFAADVVTGSEAARIEYHSRLPLVHGADVVYDKPTRACHLSGLDMPVQLFPIGLPCERVIGCDGQLGNSQNHLELRQSGVGGLYAPLVFDWNPTRRRSQAIWRRLTVAQNGQSVPARSAAGHRLQIGKSQWLIYRSLSPILEPRTVLGQHTMYETMIGRFLPNGAVEPMVLVEQGKEGTG